MTNLDRYKKDLTSLINLGDKMDLDLTIRAIEQNGKKLEKSHKELKEKVVNSFEHNYQRWYTEACAILLQLLPNRVAEFEGFYKPDSKRKNYDATNYAIQDWLMGLRAIPNAVTGKKPFEDFLVITMRFSIQLEILKSIEPRFESSLFDVKQLLQADLFDSELEAARELLKKGFLRAAGAVAGVVLESHLSQVCSSHKIINKKKAPTISDLNGILKGESVYDVPQWRFVSRLGDLRNLCDHKRDREPTPNEIAELIDGTEKISKTVY
jgi:hypothetical protein